MRQFKDSANRAWTIQVNFTSIAKIKAALEISLPDLLGGDTPFAKLQELTESFVEFGTLIYLLCEEQIEKAGLSKEVWGEAMYGDAIEEASIALARELVDFCPNRRKREALHLLVDKGLLVKDEVVSRLGSRFREELDKAIPSQVADQVVAQLEERVRVSAGNANGSAGNAPAS